MGRKSKLTEQEWQQVLTEVIGEKESVRSIATRWGVSESAVRGRLNTQVEEIRNAGKELVQAEKSILAPLDIDAQMLAMSYASRLRSISSNLLATADHQAAIAHRVSAIAAAHLDRIDDSDPMACQDALKVVSGLTSMANEASKVPLNLIAANKEQAQRLSEPEQQKAMSLDDFYKGATALADK